MTIEIVHNAAKGTLVHGTSRGDGTNTILKAAGFRWFRTLGVWGIAGSRDRQPNRYKINQAADKLRAAGHEVTVDIDATHRDVAEAEVDRAQRQEDRTDALLAKAGRKADAAEAAWDAEHKAVQALPPMGEPVKLDHYSAKGHLKAIDRAHNATRRAIDAADAAQAAETRAQAAANTTQHRYNPVTVKNRIDKLEAEQRGDQRQLDGHRRVVARTEAHTYVDEFGPATGGQRTLIEDRMAQRESEITYWKGVYADLQAVGAASTHSKDTIAKGDAIKYRGTWYAVVRTNKKSVSVHLHEGMSWTHTIGYHEISGHKPASSTDDSATASDS